jgi:heme exporter protein C
LEKHLDLGIASAPRLDTHEKPSWEDRLIASTRFLAPAAALALGVVLVAAYLAPREAIQGLAQKIFYVHAPSGVICYLGFLLAGIGGLGYLISGRESWDRFELAGAEVGVLFCTILLLTGPLWARPIWGVWWDWHDLRLSSSAFLWFIYVAHLFLRAFAVGDFMRRSSAVVAIAGTLAIPFVMYAVRIAGEGASIHPPTPQLSPEISLAFRISVLSLLVVFSYLFCLRLSVAKAEATADELA